MFVIMKNGKFVKDYTEGKKLTSAFSKAELYKDKKSAEVAAQQYGKVNGKGFKVVKL